MAAEFKFSRSQLIYGLCLPLAVILGYVLAHPFESRSLGVLVMVCCVLVVPLYMRWYHPVTIFFWNSTFFLGFLPGMLPIWVPCACSAFIMVVLNRCVDPFRRLMLEASVAWSLVVLGVVILATAHFTGGIGMRSLGSNSYGGKRYVFLLAAIAGYFVLASRRIPVSKVHWYAALFFLPGLSEMLSNLIYLAGGPFYILYYIVPAGGAYAQAQAEQQLYEPEMMRMGSFTIAAEAVGLFLLARYGMRGILSSSRPWRSIVLIGVLAMGTFGGFRSYLIYMGLIFSVAFILEGLHRTRLLLLVVAMAMTVGLGLAFFSMQLPYSVQRTLSFLPVRVAPDVQQLADHSVAWRMTIWKNVFPEVSEHLLAGKGYVLNPNDLYIAELNVSQGRGSGGEPSLAEVAGDYHNGPLSVIIPFGIWGALALVWFFIASIRVMLRHYLHGDPALKVINVTLLACFIGKVIFFIGVFGAIDLDLAFFTGLVGLSVSLNGETRERSSRQAIGDEFSPVYI